MILEQALEPDQDPRGVYLNGDAVRILWSLGVRGEHFTRFSGEPEAIHFYKTCITKPSGPYHVMQTKDDFLHQALPGGVTHVQPRLESSIAEVATASGFCEIRRGCTVLRHEILDDHTITVTYKDNSGVLHTIRCHFLIGADGKRGVVRKSFLEPTTSIRQISNPIYQYEGTWIAANVQLSLATPETHPSFPLWKLGYAPQDVFDLFCPKAWYFCSPPGKATAGGRFGPEKERLWRHEFAQPDWDESMDAEALFWEHFTPFITRTKDERGCRLACGAVAYPRDCIKVLRCRSFTFTHKVVNRWFDRRRILIGDAAHVFPPFGGQGIASGIRDAHQLAWRIALLGSKSNVSEVTVDQVLTQWARERRKSIDAATFQTKLNGQLCNEPESWGFYFFRKFLAVYEMLPLVPRVPNPVAEMDRKGFCKLDRGFFLPEYGGGMKFPQVFIKKDDGEIARSDKMLAGGPPFIKLLVLHNDTASVEAASRLIRKESLPTSVLDERSPVRLIENDDDIMNKHPSQSLLPTTPSTDLDLDVRPGYRKEALREWLGTGTKFAILRCDFHIFALLKSVAELENALKKLHVMLSGGTPSPKL